MSVPTYVTDALAECERDLPANGQSATALLKARLDRIERAKRDMIDAAHARGAKALAADEQRACDRLVELRDALTERITDLAAQEERDARAAALRKNIGQTGTAYDHAGRVGNEQRTYRPDNAHGRDGQPVVSFFADVWRAQNGDMSALDRQQRHAREVEVGRETRATTTGSFAGLVVPQYLVEQAALVARAGRPVANSVLRLPLPEQGMTFQIPRGTTGASVAAQNGENTNVSSTDEVWANVALNVVTIAGQQDVSRQSLERGTPGIDQLIYMDLAAAYATELDRQVITGSGAAGELLGILNTASINASTAYGAAASVASFYTKIAGGVNSIETQRFLTASAIYMHPRRWNWLVSQTDSSARPIVVPGVNGPNNATGVMVQSAEWGHVKGWLQGLPVVADASIPTNLGGGSTEDVALVVRADDLLLYEDGDGMPRELRFEQTLGGQLTVKVVAYGYAAFTAGRYPKAVSKVGGADSTGANGQQAPTF